MEVQGAALLYTLAGLSVTFAGFSALLLASARRLVRGCHCSIASLRERC